MTDKTEMRPETLAVHAGKTMRPDENAPIVDAITLATVFERDQSGEYKDGWSYTRAGNPNRAQLEKALAQLEGGAAAAAFGSGSAATAAMMQALNPGDHVVATAGFYGTVKLLEELFARWGLKYSLVDTSDLAAVKGAITPATKLVWLETPSNPTMKVSDIAAISKLAHAAGAKLICDNTLATPLLQRCFELGADYTMHSTTKYIGGHSDVLGGAIVAKDDDELFGRVRAIQISAGAVPSPFDCWLLLRGMRTITLRVAKQSASAFTIAKHFERHAKMERVLYAGLASHAGHEVASRQMAGGFGGLLSLMVKGGRAEALGVMSRLKLITRATSLGGVETTIDHRESVEPAGYGTPANLLRLSVGIEDVRDLIEDLEQAV